jgi:hypothetical protein
VQSLAVKLKKRQKEVQKIQEQAEKFDELSSSLESAEERLVDVVADNQALNHRVRSLQATIDIQDVEENHRWNQRDEAGSAEPDNNNTADTADANTKGNAEEYRQLKQQRDTAHIRAGEMSISLAQYRAESDDFRDQLDAIANMLQTIQLVENGSSSRSSSDHVAPISITLKSAAVTPASVTPEQVPPARTLQGSLQDLGSAFNSGRNLTKEWVSSTPTPWNSSRNLTKESATDGSAACSSVSTSEAAAEAAPVTPPTSNMHMPPARSLQDSLQSSLLDLGSGLGSGLGSAFNSGRTLTKEWVSSRTVAKEAATDDSSSCPPSGSAVSTSEAASSAAFSVTPTSDMLPEPVLPPARSLQDSLQSSLSDLGSGLGSGLGSVFNSGRTLTTDWVSSRSLFSRGEGDANSSSRSLFRGELAS